MKLNISKVFNIVGTLSSLFFIIWSISTHSNIHLVLGILFLISNVSQITNV